MNLVDLQASESWDHPFFKRLPRNDTGDAPGHQGGMVIPMDLRGFFPVLDGTTSYDNPTIDRYIRAHLFHGDLNRGTVVTRYQFQTWGGTRSPESRLTDNLSPIRNRAHAGDLLVFQRSRTEPSTYRLVLVSQGTELYDEVDAATQGRRWGPLGQAPLSQSDVVSAIDEQSDQALSDFDPFPDEGVQTTQAQREARNAAFRIEVMREYESTCVICGSCLKSPEGRTETEAAHIIPRSVGGGDDIRNGIVLCRTHHWAFDNGLISLTDERTVIVPESCSSMNPELSGLEDIEISTPQDLRKAPHPVALRWHRENVLVD